jgi:hypothetical protein
MLVADEMELHPVQQRVVSNSTRVGRPLAQGFPVSFPGPADVSRRNSSGGHQVHGVHLDLRRTDRVTASLSDLRPPPETEGHGDAARNHLIPQVPAELHEPMLGRLPSRLVIPDRHAVEGVQAASLTCTCWSLSMGPMLSVWAAERGAPPCWQALA